jgi:hypothetical protein
MNAEVARGHWFFIFNNVPDLPEALISGRKYGSHATLRQMKERL